MHDHYNKTNFPVFVANHGNWDIYANAAGTYTAAIPTTAAEANGCRASHFGSMEYARLTLAREAKGTAGK